MNENTRKILAEIEAGYDLVAEKFSDTRNFFWKELEFIANIVSPGDKILDFGCGNGRLLEILKDKNIEYHGVDVSLKLIQKAKEKYPDFKGQFSKIEAEASLPFPVNYFNVIFSLAVFHHFSREYQGKKIKELYDRLKPGGTVVLTVWNLDQKNILSSKRWETISDDEAYISFENNEGKKFQRYHFVFSEEKLKNLAEKAGFQVERCDTIGGKNIILVGKK